MYSYHEWSHRDFSLGHKLSTQFHLRTVTPENLQTIQLKRAMDEDSSDPAPIATAYIYTAPCERLMSSAVGICWELKKNKLLRSLIRVDDRLEHSCCTPDLVPARLAQVLGYVHSGSKNEDVCAQYFDEMWLEQRIHATKGGVGDSADADESGDEPAVLTQFFKRNNYSAWENVVATIIVGEEDYVRKLMDLMASKPHPESDLPRLATELYTVDRDGSGAYSHRFVGNFRRNPELFKPGDFEKAAEALHKELYPASDSVTPVDTPRSAKRQRPS